MKEALTETLVRKMRAAFAGDGDALAEDIVGEEVVAFMTHNGSTRASEIEALEARIAARLETERGANGAESGPSRVAHEWSRRSAEDVAPVRPERRSGRVGGDLQVALARGRAARGGGAREKRAGQKAMAAALAAQMRVKEDAKAAELEAKRRYKKEEERLVEAWKAEELAKLERRAAATEKLKEERRAQMRDKTSRLEAQIEAKKEEDAALRRSARRAVPRQTRRRRQRRARVAEDTARLKASNAETLRIREEQSKKEAEDDLMYQALYAEKLAKQEAESLANIQAVKDKQNALSASVGDLSKPLSERRYYAEETIARNAAIADARAARGRG